MSVMVFLHTSAKSYLNPVIPHLKKVRMEDKCAKPSEIVFILMNDPQLPPTILQ